MFKCLNSFAFFKPTGKIQFYVSRGLKKTCVQFLSSTCEGTFAAMSHVMSCHLCVLQQISMSCSPSCRALVTTLAEDLLMTCTTYRGQLA